MLWCYFWVLQLSLESMFVGVFQLVTDDCVESVHCTSQTSPKSSGEECAIMDVESGKVMTRYAHLTVLNVFPRLIYTPLTCYNFDTHGSNARIVVFICCFNSLNSFSNEVACCLVQSPASLVGSSGCWLTGCDIDSVQNLLKTKWSGAGLKSVTSEFQEQMQRPFI